MNIPISNIGSSVSFSPTELPGTQTRSAVKQQIPLDIDADKLITSLPGIKQNDIHRIAADIARISQAFNKKLQFIVDQQSNEVIVKVIDKTTDKVIKVLPPEELQRLHRKLKETIGFLFNERV